MSQTVEFLKQMNISTASRATFYRIQKKYVNPLIWKTWTEMQKDLHDEVRGEELTVSGTEKQFIETNMIFSWMLIQWFLVNFDV